VGEIGMCKQHKMIDESKKQTKGKLKWELLPLDCVEEVVKVYDFYSDGKKYKPGSWRNLDKEYLQILKGAVQRHLTAWDTVSKVDEESGITHLAHMIWNLLTMIHIEKKESS